MSARKPCECSSGYCVPATQVFHTTHLLCCIANFLIFDHDRSESIGQAGYRLLQLCKHLNADSRRKIMGDRRKYTPEQFQIHLEVRIAYVKKELRKSLAAKNSAPLVLRIDVPNIAWTIEQWLDFNLEWISESTGLRVKSELVNLGRVIEGLAGCVPPQLSRRLQGSIVTIKQMAAKILENSQRVQMCMLRDSVLSLSSSILQLAGEKVEQAAKERVLDKELRGKLDAITSRAEKDMNAPAILRCMDDSSLTSMETRVAYLRSLEHSLHSHLSALMKVINDKPGAAGSNNNNNGEGPIELMEDELMAAGVMLGPGGIVISLFGMGGGMVQQQQPAAHEEMD